MLRRLTQSTADPRRRAIVAVQVAILLVVILGFAALTVDVGTLYNVRAELQRSADAAALAGASVFTGDTMMRVRMDPQDDESLAEVLTYTNDRTTRYSEFNRALNEITHIEDGDIVPGWLDFSAGLTAVQANPASDAYNAVEVTIRRRRSGHGVNSSVPYFFAPIFGKAEGASSANAVAVFDDRFSGFEISDDSGGMLPFSIHEDALAEELAEGGDQYRFDYDHDHVDHDPDGIRELRLYPYPLSGPGAEGAGNFGVLNVGTGNQGLQALRDQIINGITADDLEAEVGTSNLTFYDNDGDPVTYDITGSPGMDGGLASAIESIEGQIVGFFVHNNVTEQGANAVYTIVQVRFGRLMDVRLNGNPNSRYLYVQPVSYSGAGVKVSASAPSSDGLMGRVMLAR
jgi:hypothetical protein